VDGIADTRNISGSPCWIIEDGVCKMCIGAWEHLDISRHTRSVLCIPLNSSTPQRKRYQDLQMNLQRAILSRCANGSTEKLTRKAADICRKNFGSEWLDRNFRRNIRWHISKESCDRFITANSATADLQARRACLLDLLPDHWQSISWDPFCPEVDPSQGVPRPTSKAEPFQRLESPQRAILRKEASVVQVLTKSELR